SRVLLRVRPREPAVTDIAGRLVHRHLLRRQSAQASKLGFWNEQFLSRLSGMIRRSFSCSRSGGRESVELSMITLRAFGNAAEAAMAKSVLDDHGISCSLADEASHLYGGAPTAMPVRLLVREDEAEKAQRILDAPGPAL